MDDTLRHQTWWAAGKSPWIPINLRSKKLGKASISIAGWIFLVTFDDTGGYSLDDFFWLLQHACLEGQQSANRSTLGDLPWDFLYDNCNEKDSKVL